MKPLFKSRLTPTLGLISVMWVGGSGWLAAAAAQDGSSPPSSSAPSDTAMARGEAALEEGRAHLAAGRYGLALDAFTTALRYMPDNAEAKQGIQDAQRMLEQGGMARDVQEDISILQQQAEAEFKDAIARAEQLLKQGDYAGAQNLVVTAKIKLENRRQLIGEQAYADRMVSANKLEDQIEQAREQATLEAEKEREKQTQQDKEREEARQKETVENRIRENLRRIRQLQEEQKYEEALQIVDQTLFLDELNPAALLLKDVFDQQILFQRYMKAERALNLGEAEGVVRRLEAMIPPRSLMEYPDDWPLISLTRFNDSGWRDTPADRKVVQVLGDKRTPLDFVDVPFDQAIDFLQKVSGVTIYVDWKSLELIGVRREDQITLTLGEVPIATAMARMLEQVGDDLDRPKFDIQDGIVTVTSDEALRKRTVTVIYDIRDLLFEVPMFDNAPDFNINAAFSSGGGGSGGGGGGRGGGGGGGTGGGGGGGSGGGGLFGDAEDVDRKTREELVQQILDIITRNVDYDGWRDNGGDTGQIQELNGNLIITNTVANHREIEGLLSQLREIRALQINVESRFLNVSNDWFEQIGFDLDLYFNTNNTVFQNLKAADPNAHLSDLYNQTTGTLIDPFAFGTFPDGQGGFIDRVPTGSTIGAPGVPGTTPFSQPPFSSTGIGYIVGPVGAPIRATQGFSTTQVVQGSYGPNGSGLVNQIADLAITSIGGLSAVQPALTFGVQFLDDVQVDLLIQATQADKRSVVLTAPRVTFFNGQRSWVAVTTQQYFATGLTPVTGDGSLALVPDLAPQLEGVVLDVEAVISADRRYVTMTVVPSVAQIVGTNVITAQGAVAGTGGVGGGAAGAISIANSFETPIVQVQQVSTTVSVPDKGTVLLGGQREVNEIEVEAGVPFLSKIPIINRFFTNRLTQKEEQTLLILVRPEIIIQQENEDRLFPGLSDQLKGNAAAYMR
jgi:type II secretory pathway component GspD/PulD (secretin)